MTTRTFPHAVADLRQTQLGLIALQADETIEADLRRLLPDRSEVLTSRVRSAEAVSTKTLAAMEHHLTAAAALLPRGARLSATAYACTSGAATIGPRRVAALIREATGVQPVTDPLTALTAACRHIGVSRIALLSPYVPDVSDTLRNALGRRDITTAVTGTFNVAEEARVVRITSDSLMDAARALMAGTDAQALFLSCTNLRTLDVIAPLEAALGKPVLSSNLVLAWHLAQLSRTPLGKSAPGTLAAVHGA